MDLVKKCSEVLEANFKIEKPRTLEVALADKVNILNFIRLAAALMVLIDHSAQLAGKPHFFVARMGFTLGELGVTTFFFLSGLLITRSWCEDPKVIPYSAKRILRIFPAFWTAVLFCVFIIGPITTTLSINLYFRNPQTLDFLKHNLLLFPTRYLLPGVFHDNPYPDAVNGQFWTLPIEFFAYICVLLMGLAGIFKIKQGILCVIAFLLYANLHWVPYGVHTPSSFLSMSPLELWGLLLVFFVGSAAYIYRDRIVLHPFLGIVFFVGFLLSFHTVHVGLTRTFLWGYVILVIGFQKWKPFLWITKFGDFSYGIYIYSFPIQMYFFYLIHDLSPWGNMALSIPVTLALSILSWKFIEYPALSLKKRFSNTYRKQVLNPEPADLS